MKLLLDTVMFLDSANASAKLSARARELLLNPDNEVWVSVVSSWEIAIKYALGKLRLPKGPERFIPEHRVKLGAELLQLDEESVLHTIRLPDIHRDPFDRMLISQAIVHGLVLLTRDDVIPKYPVRIER